MTTHDPSLLPPHIPPGREAEWCGVCLKFFCLPLIAFAAQDNIIISSCRPRRTQLVNNKASWTEACEATANPGIILPLLLLFAHYFSSPLAEDNRLNYFHTIVFSAATKGQISGEDGQHQETPLFHFAPCFPSLLTPPTPARHRALSLRVFVDARLPNLIVSNVFFTAF